MSGNLERRIVAALRGGLSAARLAALTEETEAAIVQAEASANAERQRALDPLRSPDPQQARVAMESAAFNCERLRALRPRLQVRYDQVAAAEQRQQWKRKHEALKSKRDALAAELAEVYPDAVAKLADLFDRIAANDAKLNELHFSRPSGVPLHLLGAELTARGIGGFTTSNPSIAKELRLPSWHAGSPPMWPPPQIPFAAVASAVMPVPRSGADWWRPEVRAAQAAERRAEGERVAAYYEGQERQRE